MSLSPLQTLRSARVAFTGRLASLSRAEAEKLVREQGGEPVAHLSRRVSVLVVGMDGWPLSADGTVSSRLRQAERINRDGRRLRIISELEFLELIGRRERRAEIHKTHSAESIAESLGIDVRMLRHWEALGLIRAHDNRYDFQDLVSLRTVVELVRRGVRADVISRSLHDLAELLPDTERPLAQLRIVEESPGSLVAEIGDRLVAPDGQLVLNFDAGSSDSEAPCTSMLSADGWFSRGQQLEDGERFEEALAAYDEAVEIAPRWAEVHFNRGNVLRELNRNDEALASFTSAAEADPNLAEAWFNLADLEEQAGHVGDAIESLRTALRIEPTYADAHYNLALCLESAGRLGEALSCWRRYLTLDGDSEWAALARERIGASLQPGRPL